MALVLLHAVPAASAGSCTLSSTGLALGAYQPLTFSGKRALASIDVFSTATIAVSCTAATSYTISLGAGAQGGEGPTGTRYLANLNGGASMLFNVYTEANYSTVWGDGSVGSLLAGSLPTGGGSVAHTVYGKVPAGQTTLRAGSFSESLPMTIFYSP